VEKERPDREIILYGSYARGGWVDEPHTAKGYRSNFDILIIVNDKRLTDKVDYWLKLDNRLIRELVIDKTLTTPVNFIVHTLGELNYGLAHGRYLFVDIAKDGIARYEADDRQLHVPKPKTSNRRSPWQRNILKSGFQAPQVSSRATSSTWESAIGKRLRFYSIKAPRTYIMAS
jgi:uncharacterized protein